jgi:hypothetical protein
MDDTFAAPPEIPSGSLIDRLLRHPLLLLSELERRPGAVSLGLAALIGLCFAAYGLIMGSFSGGAQYGVVPLKAVLIAVLSPLICLPSLHILSSLEGGRQTVGQCAGALAIGVALAGLQLVGFAPVAWVFSQSTSAVSFMGFLHLLFLVFALGFGLRLVRQGLAGVNGRKTSPAFALWAVIFTMVCFQMCTAARPLVGRYESMRLDEKKFFLVHWAETLRPGGTHR